MLDVAQKRAAFRELHKEGCFIIPNPWDAGSARLLQSMGFKAVASTSAGLAWSLGRPDNGVSLKDVLTHLTALCAAVDLPVNADFENAFAREPEGVAANVLLAAATGVAGLSVEDSTGDPANPLFETGLAIGRVRAARQALDGAGLDVVLVARTEGLLHGGNLDDATDRLVAFAEAGADCVFAPGLRNPADIEVLVKAVAPLPVNIVVNGPGLTLDELAELGVRRISVGGSLARAAYGAFLAAAGQIADSGAFAHLADGVAGRRLNEMFAEG